uniref:Protein S100-A1 n=1 Tax=Felis catus TaxID=9685 RepID=A0ABI7WT76_FELCA
SPTPLSTKYLGSHDQAQNITLPHIPGVWQPLSPKVSGPETPTYLEQVRQLLSDQFLKLIDAEAALAALLPCKGEEGGDHCLDGRLQLSQRLGCHRDPGGQGREKGRVRLGQPVPAHREPSRAGGRGQGWGLGQGPRKQLRAGRGRGVCFQKPHPLQVSCTMGSELETAMETLINVFHAHSGKEGDKYKLSKKELKELLQTELSGFLDAQKDADAVDKVMKELDENGDGEVDFQEYVVLVAALTVACNNFFWENS